MRHDQLKNALNNAKITIRNNGNVEWSRAAKLEMSEIIILLDKVISRNKREYKNANKRPLLTQWPITRERYRQVIRKMHRQYRRIKELETAIEECYNKLGK